MKPQTVERANAVLRLVARTRQCPGCSIDLASARAEETGRHLFEVRRKGLPGASFPTLDEAYDHALRWVCRLELREVDEPDTETGMMGWYDEEGRFVDFGPSQPHCEPY